MSEFLSNLAFYRTYAETKPNGTKETWEQCVSRYQDMLLKKYPYLSKEIRGACALVRSKMCVPSMRGLQFAGSAIEKENARLYNCAVVSADCVDSFGEFVYLLMCGCGVGYSVQQVHIEKLGPVPEPSFGGFDIPDSREGWADSIKVLMKDCGAAFNYVAIRQEGAPISTGGTASGPQVLEDAHKSIRAILLSAVGRHLTAREVSDILCICANFVFVGGVRRAACIGLYTPGDESMHGYKADNWWEVSPYRSFVNISAVMNPDTVSKKEMQSALRECFDSGFGEPGIVLIREAEKYGINPCAEIVMEYQSFCNLTEIIAPNCDTYNHFLAAAKAATFLGTLQAGFTDFSYLRPCWRENAEKQALLGVSITGQAQVWSQVSSWMPLASPLLKAVNAETAAIIGINQAERITTTKPSGTTSAVMGTASGIHAAHAPYYIRNVRITKTNPVAVALLAHCPSSTLINDEGDQICISVPETIESDIYRSFESAVTLLNRMKLVRQNWIEPGHRKGPNTHNVSLTCYFTQKERAAVEQWMWDNRDCYTGIALFPKDENKYTRAPFETVSLPEWEELNQQFTMDFGDFDFTAIVWRGADERRAEMACAGGKCEI